MVSAKVLTMSSEFHSEINSGLVTEKHLLMEQQAICTLEEGSNFSREEAKSRIFLAEEKTGALE